MKKLQSLLSLFLMVGLIVGFSSCSDDETTTPTPSGSSVSFTMEPDAAQPFHVKCTNTSSVAGSEIWVIEGTNYTGKVVSFHAPIPQTYHIKLIITTADGEVTKEDTYTTTDPDLAFLNTPWVVALTGGYGKSKTWMVESASKGHYGVGQWKRGAASWWEIDPNGRPTSESYDDELTFGLVSGATVTMKNNGKSYVNENYQTADYFSNPVAFSANNEGWIVDYNTVDLTGNWSLNPTDSTLIITSATPLFLGMYNGSSQYIVKAIDDHRIQVSCKGAENTAGEEGFAWWHYKWIEKGYVPAPVAFSVTSSVSGTTATASMTVSAGAASEVTVNWGDGSEETSTDVTKAFTHTYTTNFAYGITFSVKDKEDGSIKVGYAGANITAGTAPAAKPASVVMWNDFDATQTYAFAAGGDALTIDITNPSGSDKVAQIVSPASQWDNIFTEMPTGTTFTFDGESQIRMKIYPKAVGQRFTLELNDKNAEPWLRGVKGKVYGSTTYVAGVANEWVEVVFDFSDAVSADGIVVKDDATRKTGYYYKAILFVNPGASEAGEYLLNDVESNFVK